MKTKDQILVEFNKLQVNLFDSPHRNKPEWEGTQSGECEYCGKKCGNNSLHVHITVDGICVPNSLDEEELELIGEISQGCFPIGNGCAKKLFGKKTTEYTKQF